MKLREGVTLPQRLAVCQEIRQRRAGQDWESSAAYYLLIVLLYQFVHASLLSIVEPDFRYSESGIDRQLT